MHTHHETVEYCRQRAIEAREIVSIKLGCDIFGAGADWLDLAHYWEAKAKYLERKERLLEQYERTRERKERPD